MQFVDLFVNENVLEAKLALNRAQSDQVVAECRRYIIALKSYCLELGKLRFAFQPDRHHRSSLERELHAQTGSAVRSAIGTAVRETDRAEKLLECITSIDVNDAAAILNTCKYLGSNNWEATSSGLQFANGFVSARLTFDQAVRIATRLRCEAHVTLNRNANLLSA